MRRFLKRARVPLIVTVALGAGLWLAAGLLVPKQRIREAALARVRAATGAEVSLGDASLRLWPRLAVVLADGRIAGSGAALAARTGTANELQGYEVVLERLDVRVDAAALLRRTIVVESLRLSGPRLQVVLAKGEILAEGFSLEIGDLVLPTGALEAEAASPAEGRLPGERIPADLACVFAARSERLFWQGVPYDRVRAAGDLEGRVLSVSEVTAERGGGRLHGVLEIDWERDPGGKLDFEATATAVPAAALLEPWAPELGRRLEGDLSGQAVGHCDLRDAAAARRTLDLTGSLASGAGVLHAGDWLQDVSSYLGRRQDLKDVVFQGLEHSFGIRGNRYLVEDLHIDGRDTDWRGDGWVGLDGDIDLNVRVKLPAGFTPDLGALSFLAEQLRDAEGRVNLDLRLTGRAAKPRVGVDLGALTGKGGDEAADGVKKTLGGFLDKLRNK